MPQKGIKPKNYEYFRVVSKQISLERRRKNTEGCANCNKEVYVPPFWKKRYAHHFCSRECNYQFKTGKKRNKMTQKQIEENRRRAIKLYASGFINGRTTKPNVVKEIIKLFSEGKNQTEIEKLLKVSDALVHRIILQNGFTRKDILERSNKAIGENTKKHRPFQIMPKEDSSLEIKIQGFLKQLGIEFYTHHYLGIKHNYRCDIFIPSKRLVIECDGEYWHNYPTGRDIDNIRTSELIEKGFKVLRLWGNEIKVMQLNDFEQRLK